MIKIDRAFIRSELNKIEEKKRPSSILVQGTNLLFIGFENSRKFVGDHNKLDSSRRLPLFYVQIFTVRKIKKQRPKRSKKNVEKKKLFFFSKIEKKKMEKHNN